MKKIGFIAAGLLPAVCASVAQAASQSADGWSESTQYQGSSTVIPMIVASVGLVGMILLNLRGSGRSQENYS